MKQEVIICDMPKCGEVIDKDETESMSLQFREPHSQDQPVWNEFDLCPKCAAKIKRALNGKVVRSGKKKVESDE